MLGLFVAYYWPRCWCAQLFLVVGGLDVWNEAMADVEPGEEVIEFEATGYQFAWALRYPGEDGKLGTRDYTKINGVNSLGQVWTDEKNLDDLMVDEIVLPKGKKVRVRIIARDVLHNFYLPHFTDRKPINRTSFSSSQMIGAGATSAAMAIPM